MLSATTRFGFPACEYLPRFICLLFFIQLLDTDCTENCSIYLGMVTTVYSFSLFLPTIIAAMGYSAARSQLLTVPPYVFGCIMTINAGYLSDKYRKRAL